jgi:hypothetical protein
MISGVRNPNTRTARLYVYGSRTGPKKATKEEEEEQVKSVKKRVERKLGQRGKGWNDQFEDPNSSIVIIIIIIIIIH